ncbi:tRNA-specific adenosine deaminase [Curtobacterium citreum]|nr:tRNA-adenosine deaminase [Curtobacterium sp. AG1037]TQJ28729.1 tRNA-adenosine deaminase [Curtobacterium citreum]GGL67456.1 tRNA-specific adenosine deaminase [Curtobacterium citreum]
MEDPAGRPFTAAMDRALAEARACLATGDVPVGAVVLDADGAVVAVGRNEREARQDPTAHAEVLALRAAAEVTRDWHLAEHTLVVTLEPCPMCAGAALAARVPRIVFGAWDPKAGASGSVYDIARDRRLPHRSEVVGGVREAACAALLDAFFHERR